MKDGNPGILAVSSSRPFSPVGIFGEFSAVWRGPKASSGLDGARVQDIYALELDEVDFSKVLFTNCLKAGEGMITGEEKLVRHIAAGHICLDGRIGKLLYEEEGQTTLRWIYENRGIRSFDLAGNVLRLQTGLGEGNCGRIFLCLCKRADGDAWEYGRSPYLSQYTDTVSAVLEV